MTTLEIILSITLYIISFGFVYNKQIKIKKDMYKSEKELKDEAALAAAFGPLVIILYAIRAVFFEDWL